MLGNQNPIITNPYTFLIDKKESKKRQKLPALSDSKLNIFISLPEAEASIAQAAIRVAQRYRKKGSSELDNNYRSHKEFANINSSLNKNIENSKILAKAIIELWRTQGFVNSENQESLCYGAWSHYIIEASKSTFLGNCDSMANLILDFLDEIGYKKPAWLASINRIYSRYPPWSVALYLIIINRNVQAG